MVNLGGNVSETVILSLRDSVIGVIENMVPSIKNVRKQVSDKFLNQEKHFKGLFPSYPTCKSKIFAENHMGNHNVPEWQNIVYSIFEDQKIGQLAG